MVGLHCDGGRGGNTHGTLTVQVNGTQKWTGECRISSPTGNDYQATIAGLSPGAHRMVATSSSLSGTVSTPGRDLTVD